MKFLWIRLFWSFCVTFSCEDVGRFSGVSLGKIIRNFSGSNYLKCMWEISCTCIEVKQLHYFSIFQISKNSIGIALCSKYFYIVLMFLFLSFSVTLIIAFAITYKVYKYRRSRQFQEETQPLTTTPKTQIYQGL